MSKKIRGIGLIGLVGIVVSCCIGSGIFVLPAPLASIAAPGPALIAWGIMGIGLLTLVLSLANLCKKCPDIDGIFIYAEKGFGPLAGFISGWGYCLTACTAITGLAIILIRVLCQLNPSLFGSPLAPHAITVVLASASIWIPALLVMGGVESAAIFNACVMAVKVIALFVFIAFCLRNFNSEVFLTDFWGKLHPNVAPQTALATQSTMLSDFSIVIQQSIGCLLPMIWIFGGIEGANVVSARAARKKDVGRAAIISLFVLLVIYVGMSILPYGIIPYKTLMTFSEPSTAGVLNIMAPNWGATFISVSIGISVIGSMLSLTILPAETSSMMAKCRLLSNTWSKTNKYNSPQKVLLVAAAFAQAFLIVALLSRDAYTFASSLCAINLCVTWTFAIAFQIKYSLQNHEIGRAIIGFIALLFQIAGPFATGWKFTLLACLGYIPGLFIYAKARQESGFLKLSTREIFACIAIAVTGITSIFLTITGAIKI